MKSFTKYLKTLSPKSATIFSNTDLKSYNSFNIGGKAKHLIVAHNIKTLKEITSQSKKYFILGAGTNTLFKDKIHNFPIIKLGRAFNDIKIKSCTDSEKIVEVGSAVNLFKLNLFLKENCLGGIEWSYGIPGSVGGATIMNAGAYENCFDEYISEVRVLEKNKVFWTKKFYYSYRSSSFKNSNSIILSVRLKLKVEDKNKIEFLQKDYINRRKETQPYGENSAGSVFKRIYNISEIIYPAKIIDKIGLKGVKIGGAEISKKHSGFIVNTEDAKCEDVLKLIKLIKNKVKKETGKVLEEEIIVV